MEACSECYLALTNHSIAIIVVTVRRVIVTNESYLKDVHEKGYLIRVVDKTHRNLSRIRLSLTGTSHSPTEDPRPETTVIDMFEVDNWIEMYFGVIE